MISLLNASLLPWLAVIGVPLLIHLLTKRSRRKISLPTTRFLERSIARQSNIWKWRHLLILLMRTLAVLALVLAFARPTWLSPFSVRTGEQLGVVVILDQSTSMAYSSGGLSSLAEAQSQARSALGGLRAGDRGSVVCCRAQPTAATDTPTQDLSLLQAAIKGAGPTEERGDASAAVSLAVEQLSKCNTKTLRLVIVSDFQRTNWSEAKFEAVPAQAEILFVSVDDGKRQNLALTGLRCRPATPRLGETVTAQAEVFNSSARPARVPVRLRLSDGRSFEDVAEVGPYSTANVSFPLHFERLARIELTASIPSDNLPSDNVRYAVVDPQQMANVVVITDEAVEAPTSGAFYLTRALQPDPSSNSGFRVRAVRPSGLNNPTLKSADAVIVCNAPSMPDVQFEALARYVAGGGNLVWMLYGNGIGPQLEKLNKRLPKSEPLPLRVESLADLSGNAKGFVTLSEARYESRLLKAFRDASAAALARTRFQKFYITSEVDKRGELLLKFEDGTAAAVRSGHGTGNLLLLNMSPAPGWSDLARQETFVPLLHEFLKGILLRDTGLREFYPGGAAAASLPPSQAKITCVGPDGGAVAVGQDKATGSVIVDRTEGSGFYRLLDGSNTVAALAVNPHPDEADLRSIDPRELETKRSRQLAFLGSSSGAGSVGELNKGLPLWHYLLVIAVVCLIAEQGLRLVRVAPKGRKG